MKKIDRLAPVRFASFILGAGLVGGVLVGGPVGAASDPPFAIPARHGEITEWNAGRLQRVNQTIVMIQDLHANVGVQKNIAAILYRLNRMSKNPHGLLVCVEGASGEGDVSLLRSLPRGLRRGFESMLLRRAYLTGAELAATESAADWAQQQLIIRSRIRSFLFGLREPAPVSLSPIRLWGVDDPELYRKNWKAAKFVDKNRNAALDYFRSTKAWLSAGSEPALRKQLDLLTKLLMLRLQPDEYVQYLRGRSLNPSGPPVYMQTLAAAEEYYRCADERSRAMTKNLLAKMGQEPGITVLVTGGFHTKEIAKFLQAKGLPYAVVTPRVEVLDQDEAYRARLREED